MARRVFLHVGVPKSGTTFLQTAMWHNRELLKQQGFLYPGRRRMDHYRASQVVRGAEPERLVRNGDAWERIQAELAQWPGDGLVSHEFFSRATRNQARRAVAALAPAEVHIVLTARDYARQFPAVWQEALKMGSTESLDEFMQHAFEGKLGGAWSWQTQDVPAVLRRWAAAVTPERVHVVTLPPPGAPRELLWQRWCAVLGIDDSGFDLDVTFANESLGAPQAALLRRITPYLSEALSHGSAQHRWVRQYFGHEVLVPQAGERFGLRPRHVARLRRRSLAAVAAIERAGYDVAGDLADLVPGEQRRGRSPDNISETEMLDVAARAIDQMITDVSELTAERNHWRREAHHLADRLPRARARGVLREARSRVRSWVRR
jgi:hypothetical protein